MLELQKSKISNNIDNKNSINNIQLNESNLQNHDENININNDNSNSKIKNANTLKTKQKLSISLLHQIQRNPKTTPEEKTKINEIIEEIKNKNYYYCLSDLNGANKDMIISMDQNREKIIKPELIKLPDSIDYDIEFYKIGKKCNALKKRYAIIKKGKLYSSDKPLKQMDKKKLKEKTQYLQEAEVINETIDEQSANGGEWSNKNKRYRIRINYIEDKKKKEYSSFFLYFDDKKEMNEVNLALFNICKKDNYKIIAKNSIHNLKQILLNGNKFYTILKILSVKDMYKKRKTSITLEENANNYSAKKLNLNLNSENISKKDEILMNNSSMTGDKRSNLYTKKNQKQIINDSYISDYMPLIAKISTDNNELNTNTKTLNEFVTKINNFKNIIPQNILNDEINENNQNGICFSIKQGIQIKNNFHDNYFRLEQEKCKNTKYIFINKIKNEILFKEDNNDNNQTDLNILTENNINEISNIIKNSSNNLQDEEENNLIIFGPKIDNNKGINYKYINNENFFSDPEIANIKKKTINTINNKEETIINLKIVKQELDINNPQIKDMIQPLMGNSLIDSTNINNLLFWYKIRLSQLKSIETSLVPPISFNEGICFIEHNHQHLIPIDYFNKNQEIIIESYVIPLSHFDNAKYNQIGFLTKLSSSLKIGYIEFDIKDIIERKNKYQIMNEDNIPIDDCFIYVNGSEEKIQGMNIKNNIEGKDYSIGNDSYVIKKVNKEFFEKVKNNNKISDEIKSKYFNVKYDSNSKKEILFRPNENMDEKNFINDISIQVSKRDLQKIIKNKKYNYLPYCEKYEDKETLFKSKNLSCLPGVYKYFIIDNYNPGQWIYKIPEIKVKILSKNLGIIRNTNKITQKIYCTEEEEQFPLDALKKINEDEDEDEEKIIPISENNYNIFDFKELSDINLDNYQWQISIKFNNSLQMESFIKLLNISKQNINTMKKSENRNMLIELKNKNLEYNSQKLFMYSNNTNYNKVDVMNNCDLCIEYIDFINEFNLVKNPSILEAKLCKDHLTDKSLPQDEEQKPSTENSIPFPKNIQIDKDKFNKGNKIIYLKEHLLFNLDKELIYDTSYKLLISLGDFDFFTHLDFSKALNNTNYNILELPLYKKDEQGNNIIYALIEITISEIGPNPNFLFQNKYEEYNRKYLREPLLILKDDLNNTSINITSKSSHFGLNEPNVYRRKIMNLIHNNKNIIIDFNNLEKYNENDLKQLYQILYKECAVLPDLSNFPFFQFSDLRRNNSSDEMTNSFRKKIGLDLLRIKRHSEFMKIYRENSWELFLKKIKKGDEFKDPFEYFSFVQDKKTIFKNKNDINNIQDLMYLGVPSKQYREVTYSLLLDLVKFYEKTREIILNKYQEEANSPKHLFNFFVNQLYEDDQKVNIIFSLIDNDSNYISSIENSSLEEINNIKKIAKVFFIWAELRIGLIDKDDKYVYFIGLLSLTQKLLKYFEESYLVFWLLVGLSQNIAHFHQKNPLFSDEMNYINLYGLVSKLIMERHQSKIFDKFISLNIPPELFISRHLSTFFTDYFKDELMMRILDIIIFEISFQDSFSDNLQYLRVLCAIPITLFEFNEDRLLACKSVSEIESIINDLNLQTFNHDKFISKLGKNINKFYVVSSFLETWFFNNKGREWDNKRAEIEILMRSHFYPVYNENRIYLYDIASKIKANSQDIIDIYFDNLSKNMNSMKSIYFQGKNEINDNNAFMGFALHISNLKQIYNNESCDMNKYKLIIHFGNFENQIDQRYKKVEFIINFDTKNNDIININDLFYKNQFPIAQFPKYLIFSLLDKNKKQKATFSYKIFNYELMKLSKIILENKEETNKFFLEFVLFKFMTQKISSEDLSVYNNIFSSPEYFHSNKIEEKLYSYYISDSRFNKNMHELIKNQNNNRNTLINGAGFDQNMVEIFQKMNNNKDKADEYNQKRINFINKKNNQYPDIIAQKVSNLIESCMQKEISTIVINWLNDSKISIEEIFYSIILVDKSLISINEKLHTIFSVGQLKDRFLFNIDEISVSKVKEIIYSLYKRFRIYFTKTDVERMLDFILKDERLLNIKYAFVHNKKDIVKINDFIYDKDYYEPNINKEKKSFEIFFDDITKEIIIYLNHLKNHYNLNSFSYEIMTHIFNSIMKKKDLNKYKQNNLDTITLVIEKENILYKRYYTINYSPSLNIIEEMVSPNFIKPKDANDILNCELCYEISNIDINNTYNSTNYINFNKFKEIFFKLPYLSDLFRVSFSYINQECNISKKEFESFKVIVGYEGYSKTIFYFPYKTYEDEGENDYDNINKYDMNYNVKISDTVDKILNNIINKINDKKFRINNEEAVIIDYLRSFYKIECFVWYDVDEFKSGRIIQEKIGYFDNLYSCPALKNKNRAEIHVNFNNDIMTLNSNRKPVQKEDGYCKIYYSTNNDFIWKKCKVKRNNMNYSKLVNTDYITKPRILNKSDDILFAYDI